MVRHSLLINVQAINRHVVNRNGHEKPGVHRAYVYSKPERSFLAIVLS